MEEPSSKASPCQTQGIEGKAAGPKNMDWLRQACNMQTNSLFFGKLPPEVRNEIYGYLLFEDDEIVSGVRRERWEEPLDEEIPLDPQIVCTAIARTCRLSLYETYPILYGRNTIVARDSSEIERFRLTEPSLLPGSLVRSVLIRRMVIRVDGCGPCTPAKPLEDLIRCLRSLRNFPVLEYLSVDVGKILNHWPKVVIDQVSEVQSA